MRFEIRGGGIAAILVAVTLLSCAVFVLGLLAGYDVGREAQIDTAQVATAYPLQPPPSAAASATAPDNANPASEPGETLSSASSSQNPPAAQMRPASNSAPRRPSRQHVASNIPPSQPPPMEAASEPPAETEPPEAAPPPAEAPSEHTAALENPPPRIHRKPYNIQIQAAMDMDGANQMVRRLQQLGYSPHLVPTDIGGQRWYKVEVGPYATQDEAASAEAQLRQKYNATYGGGGQPARAADSDSE